MFETVHIQNCSEDWTKLVPYKNNRIHRFVFDIFHMPAMYKTLVHFATNNWFQWSNPDALYPSVTIGAPNRPADNASASLSKTNMIFCPVKNHCRLTGNPLPISSPSVLYDNGRQVFETCNTPVFEKTLKGHSIVECTPSANIDVSQNRSVKQSTDSTTRLFFKLSTFTGFPLCKIFCMSGVRNFTRALRNHSIQIPIFTCKYVRQSSESLFNMFFLLILFVWTYHHQKEKKTYFGTCYHSALT